MRNIFPTLAHHRYLRELFRADADSPNGMLLGDDHENDFGRAGPTVQETDLRVRFFEEWDGKEEICRHRWTYDRYGNPLQREDWAWHAPGQGGLINTHWGADYKYGSLQGHSVLEEEYYVDSRETFDFRLRHTYDDQGLRILTEKSPGRQSGFWETESRVRLLEKDASGLWGWEITLGSGGQWEILYDNGLYEHSCRFRASTGEDWQKAQNPYDPPEPPADSPFYGTSKLATGEQTPWDSKSYTLDHLKMPLQKNVSSGFLRLVPGLACPQWQGDGRRWVEAVYRYGLFE